MRLNERRARLRLLRRTAGAVLAASATLTLLAGCASSPRSRTGETLSASSATQDIVYLTDVVGPHLALVALGPGPDGKGNTRLLLSTDSGATFRAIGPRTPSDMMPDSVFVLTHDDIWLAAASQLGGKETLYRTRDGGRTWQHDVAPAHVLSASSADVMDFTTARAGWLADLQPTAPSEVIYRTNDSGRHWHRTAAKIAGRLQFDHNGLIGWSAGGKYFVGGLRKTTDGGLTWHQVPIPAGTADRFGTPAVFGTTIVEPVTTLGRYQEKLTTWTSTDGGAHWAASRALTIPLATKNAGRTVSTSFPRRDVGWAAAIGAHGVIVFRTTDRGERWARLPLPALPKLASRYPPVIQAAGPTRAWLTVDGTTTEGRSVYATSDGGSTWQRLTLP